MADSYCAQADLYAHGFPRGAVPNPGRLADSVLASTDAIALDVHGFDLDSPVIVRAEAGGVLPAPLVALTTYYAIPVGESSFKLALTPGGSAIDLTTDGDSVIVIAPLPIAATISAASRLVDDMIPLAAVPLTAPYPEIIVVTTAQIAASMLAGHGGFTSAALSDVLKSAQARLERWAAGAPIRGANEPTSTACAVSIPQSDARGWSRFGGI